MVDEDKYVEWYWKACDHVKDQALLPKLSKAEIERARLISREDWMMFAKATHQDKSQAVNYPEPNIYLRFEDGSIRLGLTFNNAPAVDRLTNVLKPGGSESRQQITKLLRALPATYKTVVSRKMAEYYGPSPMYESELEIQSNKLDDEGFKKIIETCIKIREEGRQHRQIAKHQSYRELPVVDLARIVIAENETVYLEAVDSLILLFKVCLSVPRSLDVEDTEILCMIQQIENGEWALGEPSQREWLSEELRKRFEIVTTPLKLAKIWRRKLIE